MHVYNPDYSLVAIYIPRPSSHYHMHLCRSNVEKYWKAWVYEANPYKK